MSDRVPRLARVPRAAVELDVSEQQLRAWCREGRLTNYSGDSHWRVDLNEAIDLLRADAVSRDEERS